MRIARRFIEDVIARTDIVDLIDSYVPLKKAGRSHVACCPFHSEKSPSFHVSSEKQLYHCFGCGVSGNVVSFLMEYARLDFVEAIEELASRQGTTVMYEEGVQTPSNEQQHHPELYAFLDQVTEYYIQKLRESTEARQYLKQRGISNATIKQFRLGYAPAEYNHLVALFGATPESKHLLSEVGLLSEGEKGRPYERFRQRLMFPIVDQRGRVIGFGGRVLNDSKPKYLNSPETALFQKGKELYGWFQAKQQKPKYAIVVEGYMDVIALHQYGFSNAVATLGTATSKDHLSRLFRSVEHIIFCFDGDEAGHKAAWRALEIALPLLSAGRQLQFAFLPEGDDPDSFVQREGKENFLNYLNQAKSLSIYLFEQLQHRIQNQRLNPDSPEGRARLVELAKPLISQIPAENYREILLQELMSIARVNSQNLTTLIETSLPKKSKFLTSTLPRARSPLLTTQLSEAQRVIMWLLQQPHLFVRLHENELEIMTDIATLDSADAGLLLAVAEFLERYPQSTTTTILTHWRGTPHEVTLQNLYARSAQLAQHNEQEFFDTVRKLNQRVTERQLNEQLTQHSLMTLTPSEMSAEEKERLKQLVQAKAHTKNKLKN